MQHSSDRAALYLLWIMHYTVQIERDLELAGSTPHSRGLFVWCLMSQPKNSSEVSPAGHSVSPAGAEGRGDMGWLPMAAGALCEPGQSTCICQSHFYLSLCTVCACCVSKSGDAFREAS